MSAGIYIHVPFCAVKCPYCDFYSVRFSREAVRRYADAVCRNLAALPDRLQADTVYFGGGTPSLLPTEIIQRFLDTIRQRCLLSADAEITLEANPLTATDEKLTAWRESGINRLSLGIQSFDAEILRILGRKHTPEQGLQAIRRAKSAGFSNLSIDLMLGLKQHTQSRWQQELETAIAQPVTHISAYLLKIEPQTPFGSNPPDMPDDDILADRYLQMHDVLTANGFTHYEISNFARCGSNEKQSKVMISAHNTKYWRLEPYYGIGPAAHSCYGGVRYAVSRDLEAFCSAPLQEQIITEPHAESESERIMLGLRLKEGIRLDSVPQSRTRLMQRAKLLIPEYLECDGETLRMTPQGWLVSNAVLLRLGI